MKRLGAYRRGLTRLLMWLWPFSFAHIRLMKLLNPPPVPTSSVVCKLRGYPLKLKVDPQTYIGRYLYYRGMYEEQVIKKMRSLLRPGMTFLDVGANIGLHTVVAAHGVGATGNVISIEPQENVFQQLNENISLNKLKMVKAFRCALGTRDETRNLYQVSRRNSGQATLALGPGEAPCDTESVEVRTLSSLAEDAGVKSIHGVKIDVEGAEMEVLLGAVEYFQRTSWPEFILVECIEHHLNRFGASSKQLLDFLAYHQYKIYGLHRARWELNPQADGLQADVLAIRGK